jgi:L-2-hydroxyglutarate oxidase
VPDLRAVSEPPSTAVGDPAPSDAPAARADVVVVGGGIVGLATAYRLLERRPGLRLVLLEREPDLARHQTGHNSGVLHAGLYYAPGSLKARLCREGKAELEAFADAHAIPYRRIGKLVVAVEPAELPRLQALSERARANGVPGVELVGPERIREIEPHVRGLAGIWSPTTGIIDFRAVAFALADHVRRRGGTVETGRAVTGLRERSREVLVETTRGPIVAAGVVVCAGLWADRLARASGDRPRERIIPFRGDYYTLVGAAAELVRGLIYPVPDPRFPFLGVHFTRRIDGSVWAGPNAVLAGARAGYRRRDIDLRDLAEIVTSRGFLRLAARHWRAGLLELWRDLSKRAYLAELRRFIPELGPEDLVFGSSGVRAQAVDPDGSLVDDFRLGGSRRILHVRNAPSPAATASLAIGRVLAAEAIDRFELEGG